MRGLLYRLSLASVGTGLLAFAASDALWARLSFLTLDAARDATLGVVWRSTEIPTFRGEALVDLVGIAGLVLLIVLGVARQLPNGARRPVGLAIALLALGLVVSFARRFVDQGHDHEGAWGALQVGIMGSALVALVWRVRAARALAFAGAAVLLFRQPMMWRASDEFVRATGDATAAYGAELAKFAAHAIGAAGALLLAIALLWASARLPQSGFDAVGKREEGARGTLPPSHEGDNAARGAV